MCFALYWGRGNLFMECPHYLLNCDKLRYFWQVFLYQLLVLEHYLGNRRLVLRYFLGIPLAQPAVWPGEWSWTRWRRLTLLTQLLAPSPTEGFFEVSRSSWRGRNWWLLRTCCVDWGTLVTSWLVAGLSTSTHLGEYSKTMRDICIHGSKYLSCQLIEHCFLWATCLLSSLPKLRW